MFKITQRDKKGLCQAFACSNSRKSNGDKLCSKHRHRHNKITKPVRYAYETLRSNAKRRGKSFTLTFEEFSTFCVETNYIDLKGRHINGLSVDRINPSKGYSADNIQALTIRENSSKKDSYEEPPF